MKKFEQNRIVKVNLKTKSFKFFIPISYVKPKKITDRSCVFIFNAGLGGTNSFHMYMDNLAFDENYFVSYEKMGHGENKNRRSQFKNPFLKELDCIVDWAKKEFPNRKIYLLGESWGCAINFLYLKKWNTKVDGVINWNMPTKIINTQKRSFKRVWQCGWRNVVTFLTNADLHLPLEPNHRNPLTRNEILKRVCAMYQNDMASNSARLTISVWRYMRPSYKFLLNNASNSKYNFLYVQSCQDALMTRKHIEKISNKADEKHFQVLKTGYHILSMEPEEAKVLHNLILKFVGQK